MTSPFLARSIAVSAAYTEQDTSPKGPVTSDEEDLSWLGELPCPEAPSSTTQYKKRALCDSEEDLSWLDELPCPEAPSSTTQYKKRALCDSKESLLFEDRAKTFMQTDEELELLGISSGSVVVTKTQNYQKYMGGGFHIAGSWYMCPVRCTP
jgi:hypothetical protein